MDFDRELTGKDDPLYAKVAAWAVVIFGIALGAVVLVAFARLVLSL
jgi:hypothetical protein